VHCPPPRRQRRGEAQTKVKAAHSDNPEASPKDIAETTGVKEDTVRRLIRRDKATEKPQPGPISAKAPTSTPAPEPTDEAVEEPEENLIEEEVSAVRPRRRPPSDSNLQKEDMLQKFKNHVDHHLNPMFKYLGDYVVPPNRHPWIQDLRDELGSLLGEGA
jgi:hypothetical protein